MRAVLIDELYHLFDEAAADEKAGLLEQVWNADTAYNNAVGLWMDQERQRLLDIANGAPEYPAAKHPVPDVSIRIQSRAQLIRDAAMDRSQRFKELPIQRSEESRVGKECVGRIRARWWR